MQTQLICTFKGNTNIPGRCGIYLLNAAGYYGLQNDRLKAMCCKNLLQGLHEDNILSLLQAANDVKAEQLKAFLLDELIKQFPAVVTKSNVELIRALNKDLLVEIMLAVAKNMKK
jgi:hypothetical protein